MEIINDIWRNVYDFVNIEPGRVFFYNERYAMAIQPILYPDGSRGANAVYLDNGESTWVNDYETVDISFSAKLTIS